MNEPRNRFCVAVCENLACEVAAVIAAEKLDDVAMATFPARCDVPQVDWETLAAAQCRDNPECLHLYVLGRCAAVGLGEPPPELGPTRWHKVDSCLRLFAGQSLLDYHARQGGLLLAPWELPHRCKDAASGIAGRAAARLVLLDTGVDAANAASLQDLATSAGLPFEIVPVGLELFRLFLSKIVTEWRLGEEKGRSTAALSEAIRRSSDHAMALDLIGSLTRTVTEAEAIENILDLFTLLFASGRLVYIPLIDDRPGPIQARPAVLLEAGTAQEKLMQLQEDYAWTASGSGFLLRIGHQEETLGLLEVEEVAFPEHLEHYLNLALILGRVCGLTISNARAYERSQQAEAVIRHQAYHDTLTGLPNRQLFNERLTAALAQTHRNGPGLAVLFVDVDYFKQINDTLGHEVGDELLKEVAGRLQRAVRADDTVARMGGDEFLLLLPDIGRPEDAVRVVKRVRQVLSPPFTCAGHEVCITVSIGVALYPQDGRDAEMLLKNSDAAMYRVKERGRDGYQLYGEE